MNQLLRYLQAASSAPTLSEAPDRELLARFARQRDTDAFAALVARHGTAVWAACRRMLDRDEDAEDAFQAVFLTLARKAASVGNSLPAWLHGVARRIAANVRRNQRRRTRTESAARIPESRTTDVSWREGLAILDEELARLPDRYRAVLNVCCLDGRSRDEAARHLGCSEGQVKDRLERGRELLRSRLARRGIDLGAVLLAATVARGAAAVPDALLDVAVRLATGPTTAGVSSAAFALSEKVVCAMLVQKLKVVAVVVLATCLAVGGTLVPGSAEGTEPGSGETGQNAQRNPVTAFDPRADAGGPVTQFRPAADPLNAPGKPADGAQPKRPVTADPDPKALRDPGNRFDVEVTGRTDGGCSGTELYFYDSDLGTAAVHAGLVKVGERAVITVTVVRCPRSGEGSTRNGVKSAPWDAARPSDTALVLQRIPKEDRPAVKEPEGLTIDQALLAARGEKVAVIFEVAAVQTTRRPRFGASESRALRFTPKHGPMAGGEFHVILSDKAVTPLYNLGLMDARGGGSEFFRGKTIRVTGKVEPIENPKMKRMDYHLVIVDPDDLVVVK
ncbi:sigma-70 family RNA polymerase sigma factor [Frigoriglobus tundricola]|uniref:ECF RNA polymerase sigma factor SigE n=1 Tax=Frigoriglobus tundricola TaxID=2774151 RepID=A0A6M5YIX1_9BACT|nr:sigma-70 family RNA polymerase sigma factor [Frigoriglobus tundricola]QJW93928.1 hypothetical protein FTUN_1442 [Frigoriglobus tundricola]